MLENPIDTVKKAAEVAGVDEDFAIEVFETLSANYKNQTVEALAQYLEERELFNKEIEKLNRNITTIQSNRTTLVDNASSLRGAFSNEALEDKSRVIRNIRNYNDTLHQLKLERGKLENDLSTMDDDMKNFLIDAGMAIQENTPSSYAPKYPTPTGLTNNDVLLMISHIAGKRDKKGGRKEYHFGFHRYVDFSRWGVNPQTSLEKRRVFLSKLLEKIQNADADTLQTLNEALLQYQHTGLKELMIRWMLQNGMITDDEAVLLFVNQNSN